MSNETLPVSRLVWLEENSMNMESGKKAQESRSGDSEPVAMPSYNPSMSDDLEEDLEKIKGDAIGDTLYSERFVLSTLLKVANCKKDLSEHENFEQDLCTLWDMTIEHDVVKLLLEHQTLEIFATLISVTDDKRLTEILIGIIANMCDYPQTRKELSKSAEIVSPILDLISCADTLTLVQLMRFLNAVLVSDSDVDAMIWFEYLENCENFVDHFSFMLANSMNKQLLSGAIDTMTAFCVKFSLVEDECDSSVIFRDLFVHECLVKGLIEAFKTLSPINDTSQEDTSTLTNKTKKLHSNFLDINVMLLQYEKKSRDAYQNLLEDFLKCIAQILVPFCDPSTLFSVSHHELEVLDCINEVFELLAYPFDSECLKRVVEVWNVIETSQPGVDQDLNEEWNKDDSWHEIGKETSTTLLELFMRIAKSANEEQLTECLQLVPKPTIDTLLKSLSKVEKGTEEFIAIIKKIEKSINCKDAQDKQ